MVEALTIDCVADPSPEVVCYEDLVEDSPLRLSQLWYVAFVQHLCLRAPFIAVVTYL